MQTQKTRGLKKLCFMLLKNRTFDFTIAWCPFSLVDREVGEGIKNSMRFAAKMS